MKVRPQPGSSERYMYPFSVSHFAIHSRKALRSGKEFPCYSRLRPPNVTTLWDYGRKSLVLASHAEKRKKKKTWGHYVKRHKVRAMIPVTRLPYPLLNNSTCWWRDLTTSYILPVPPDRIRTCSNHHMISGRVAGRSQSEPSTCWPGSGLGKQWCWSVQVRYRRLSECVQHRHSEMLGVLYKI